MIKIPVQMVNGEQSTQGVSRCVKFKEHVEIYLENNAKSLMIYCAKFIV